MALDYPEVGQRVTLRYQSLFHYGTEKTEMEGEVVEIGDPEFYVELDDGRVLAMWPDLNTWQVCLRRTDYGRIDGRQIGDYGEWHAHDDEPEPEPEGGDGAEYYGEWRPYDPAGAGE